MKFSLFPSVFNYVNFILISIGNVDSILIEYSLFYDKNLMAGMICRNMYKLHLYWLNYLKLELIF